MLLLLCASICWTNYVHHMTNESNMQVILLREEATRTWGRSYKLCTRGPPLEFEPETLLLQNNSAESCYIMQHMKGQTVNVLLYIKENYQCNNVTM